MGIGVKVAQSLLVAFNFVFVLIGLASIIAGAIIRVKYDDYEALVSKDIGGVSVLLITLGGIIFIVAFFGCCGALRKSVVMLTIYIILLVILLVIEVAGAITAYVYKGKVKDYVEEGMEHAMDNYNKSNKYKKAFDTVQKNFDCCGINSSLDYRNHGYPLPKSCCGDLKANETCTEHNAYKEGCVDALFDYLEDHMAIIGGLAAAVAVIQKLIVFTVNEYENICIAGLNCRAGYATDCELVGIVFACIVRRDVKEGYGYV